MALDLRAGQVGDLDDLAASGIVFLVLLVSSCLLNGGAEDCDQLRAVLGEKRTRPLHVGGKREQGGWHADSDLGGGIELPGKLLADRRFANVHPTPIETPETLPYGTLLLW